MKYSAKPKALNLKNMKEALVSYSGNDQAEFDRIWDALYVMTCCGFITSETWKRFFYECCGWNITDDNYLIDSVTGKIIFDFNNGVRNNKDYEEYHA